MFKTASLFGRFSKKSKHNIQRSLHEFSIAEFSSAIEMLYAAKLSDQSSSNEYLTKGFIRHALDEYKHTEMFRKIIGILEASPPFSKVDTRFAPVLAVNKGYINPKNFLYDRYDLDRFSIFIGVNESSAYKLFNKLKNKLAEPGDIELSIDNIEIIKNTFELILEDEKRHAAYAFNYTQNNVTRVKFYFFKTYEILAGHLRSLYASQSKINMIIAKIIYSIVISLMYPLRSAIQIPKNNKGDLLSPHNEKLMI